jgi:hypothetical protein
MAAHASGETGGKEMTRFEGFCADAGVPAERVMEAVKEHEKEKKEKEGMKTVEELQRLANKGWKYWKLWVWVNSYSKKANEWSRMTPPVDDDRRVFINVYHMVYEAIDSLPVEPPVWVRVAINRAMEEEFRTMNEIVDFFEK